MFSLSAEFSPIAWTGGKCCSLPSTSRWHAPSCCFLFFTHVVRVWHILALSFVVGLGQSFGGPAYSACCPPWLVLRPRQRHCHELHPVQPGAHPRPDLGGVTYTLLGATWCFTLNGVSYLAVILSLFMIQVKFVPAKSREPVLTSMAEGIRFIRCRDGMSALVVLAFCTTLFGFSLTGFLPVFVQTIFHRGPETYTLLLVFSEPDRFAAPSSWRLWKSSRGSSASPC